MNSKKILLLAVTVSLIATACGQRESAQPNVDGEQPKKEAAPQPITLSFLNSHQDVPWAAMAKQLTEKKFPHITLNVVQATTKKEETLAALLTAGQQFDLIYAPLGELYTNKELRVYTDLNPLMKKHGFDTTRFVPGVMETLKSYGDNGDIPVFPFVLNNHALFYNKALFDKFAVPYPKDGMNWDDVYEIAKKMTRHTDGIQYKGFNFNELNIVYKNQLGQTFVDYKTLKGSVNTDPWKRWMDLHASFFNIPGNESAGAYSEQNQFLKEQILAMRTGPNLFNLNNTTLEAAVQSGLDFDLVTYPTIKGTPSNNQMNSPILGIAPTSKQQDAAFQVLAYWLSDEVQTLRAKAGYIPVVKNEDAKKVYAGDLTYAKGKNLEALFKDSVGTPVTAGKYDGKARAIANEALRAIMTGKKDTNTALREADEEINKYIEAELKK
ncbi:carbohydrate ABC transporter substrate-binding protein [Paenibacillus hemerocallicola]|uniref:Carbohydrate ABC transporter substrate-binding protein n=1 Tax=Paenibacillus hemerocallicola TaxID=1172614 RepID=A0A5C4T601_9BACL|nr:ABC transporter substrate-binding protein [Paenibacillus hemerocallicola]TNJ64478.1 carbohydrate ABC transporter substrate-binding protein [Paenibacillus hemerocallicola]